MTMNLYKSSTFKNFEEYITINKSGKGIRFSAEFCKRNKLEKQKYVQFYTFTDNDYKFAVVFSEEKTEGSFILNKNSQTRSYYGLCVNAFSFVNNTPILRHNAKESKVSYELTFDKEYNAYCFDILPSFEQKTSNVKNIHPDLKGIYQLRDYDDNIIYIGKGNIKDRVRSHIEKDWDINVIEYSEVEDPTLRSDSETIHLNNFEEKYMRKPLHNLIAGKELSFLKEVPNVQSE